MRQLFLLLFVFGFFCHIGFSFSDEIFDENLDKMDQLENIYFNDESQNVSFTLDFPDPVLLEHQVFFAFAGLSSQIENSTFFDPSLSAIFVKGGNFASLSSLASNGDFCDSATAPDFARSGQGWRCDFDSDGCVEYISQNLILPNLTYNFSYGNLSILVNSNSTYTQVPSQILDLIRNQSPPGTLNLSINGSILVQTTLIDRTFGIDSCVDRSKFYSTYLNYSSNSSYSILGSKVLFFQLRPIVDEQLSQNSHFDILVFSGSPILNATYLINGQIQNSKNISNFTIFRDKYDLVRVNLSLSDSVLSSNFNPYLLQKENSTYSYLFMPNFTYFAFSKNNLSLVVSDLFDSEHVYSSSIISRSLSISNKTQYDVPNEPIFARPSVSDSMLLEPHLKVAVPLIFLGFFLISYLGFRFFLR